MKQTAMSRSAKPVTMLMYSLKIPYVLAWKALGTMTKNNMAGLELVNEVKMRIILLRDVTIIFLWTLIIALEQQADFIF